jgi:hypothetical protein
MMEGAEAQVFANGVAAFSSIAASQIAATGGYPHHA